MPIVGHFTTTYKREFLRNETCYKEMDKRCCNCEGRLLTLTAHITL